MASGASGAVTITNLKEFQAALRRAVDTTPRVLNAALKTGGQPMIPMVAAVAAHRSGTLAGGYKVSVRGTTGSIVNTVPYAGGAEWGKNGKWKGFNKYGAPPRFAGKIIEQQAPQTLQLVADGLRAIITIEGWAR